MLHIGDKAPDFLLAIKEGENVTLKNYSGKVLVLYFYPKDDTPGCTIEAKDFSSLKDDLAKIGAEIIGVSRDDIKSHDKFKEKHCLNITLGSDIDDSVCNSYGVLVEKSMYGKTYMGIDRTTFLIDKNGIIKNIWRKVTVDNHAQEVRKFVQEMQNA